MNSHFRTATRSLGNLFFWHMNGSDSAKAETWRHQLRRILARRCHFRVKHVTWIISCLSECYKCAYLSQTNRHPDTQSSFTRNNRVIFSFWGFAVNQIARVRDTQDGKRHNSEQNLMLQKFKMNSNPIHRNDRITFSSLSSSVLRL
jgi:hypothetical protein